MLEEAQLFGFDSKGQPHKFGEIHNRNVEIRAESFVYLRLPAVEVGMTQGTADGNDIGLYRLCVGEYLFRQFEHNVGLRQCKARPAAEGLKVPVERFGAESRHDRFHIRGILEVPLAGHLRGPGHQASVIAGHFDSAKIMNDLVGNSIEADFLGDHVEYMKDLHILRNLGCQDMLDVLLHLRILEPLLCDLQSRIAGCARGAHLFETVLLRQHHVLRRQCYGHQLVALVSRRGAAANPFADFRQLDPQHIADLPRRKIVFDACRMQRTAWIIPNFHFLSPFALENIFIVGKGFLIGGIILILPFLIILTPSAMSLNGLPVKRFSDPTRPASYIRPMYFIAIIQIRLNNLMLLVSALIFFSWTMILRVSIT